MENKTKYEFDKYWYLGFLAVFGIPDLLHFFQGEPYHWLGFLWFLWLLSFLPIVILNITTACTLCSRPQTPKERPYVIKSVTFPSKSPNVQLAGELTLPKGEGCYPAVILITGSGPQDRDETVLGHKPFLVIADYLTRMGFAVLRYDDRGVGNSTGGDTGYANADLFDFANDAVGAYSWLEKQPHINKKKMGYLGHSEGGYIAPVAALKTPASFMIFLASPAKPLLPDVMITQSEDLARSQGQPSKVVNDYKQHYLELTRILKQSKDPEAAKDKMTQWFKAAGATQVEIKAYIDVFANRWGLTYAHYDPLPALKSFKRPVLALYGGKDLQVSARENAPVMKRVLSHPQSKICTFSNKNHLFQNSEIGRIDEYRKITTTIEPVVLEKISEWLEIVTGSNQGSHFQCE